MKNTKLIRLVNSLVLLPMLSVSPVSSASVAPDNSVNTYSQVVSSAQNSKGMKDLLSFNQKEEDLALKLKNDTLSAQAEAIDAYFKKYDMPLEGTGMKMAIESEKNGLDWRLIPAIAVRESTGGKFSCKKVTNSFFGWGSCKINFKSKDEAIEIVARNLGGNNPNTDHHYAGKTTFEILQKYNPPSIVKNYAPQVMKIMDAIGPMDIIDTTEPNA
jgi:hypothetical protein